MTVDPYELAIQQLEAPDYQRDVYQWAQHKLGVFMWSLPRTIAEMVRDMKRTGVYACHDSSKSHTAAILGCHHIDTHVSGEARLITTAPSGPQVKGVLWGEINKMWETARERGTPLIGRVNQTEWWIGQWQAGLGRKPSDYKPEQFAGFHARYPFIILDEADGLPDDMWNGVEALMTNRKARMLAIGNPLDPGSRFAKVLDDPQWKIIKISAFDTPNFTGEDVPELLKDVLLDPEWVEAKRLEWGGARAREDPEFQPDHPFWYGRVLAEYPKDAQFVIMKVTDVEACMVEPDDLTARIPSGMRQLGVDVAGSEKGDVTVCRERVGRHLMRKWTFQSGDDDEIIDFIVDCAKQMQANILCFDATGMGTFVPGRLRAKLPGIAIVPINFASSADQRHDDGSRKYENMRAQLWWSGREMSRDRTWDLSMAEDQSGLEFELVAARYRPDVLSEKRVVQVESKDDIRRRIGRSPDDADASLLAFHSVKGAGVAVVSTARGQTVPIGAASVVRR